MAKHSKEDLFVWVAGEIRKKVDDKKFGNLTVVLEEGRAVALKFEERIHPPLDEIKKLG